MTPPRRVPSYQTRYVSTETQATERPQETALSGRTYTATTQIHTQPGTVSLTLGPNSGLSQAQRIRYPDNQEVYGHDMWNTCPPSHLCPTASIVHYSTDISTYGQYCRPVTGRSGISRSKFEAPVVYLLHPLKDDQDERAGRISLRGRDNTKLNITATDRPFDPTEITHRLSRDHLITIQPRDSSPLKVEVGWIQEQCIMKPEQCPSCDCSCDAFEPVGSVWYLEPGGTLQIDFPGQAQRERLVISAAREPSFPDDFDLPDYPPERRARTLDWLDR